MLYLAEGAFFSLETKSCLFPRYLFPGKVVSLFFVEHKLNLR